METTMLPGDRYKVGVRYGGLSIEHAGSGYGIWSHGFQQWIIGGYKEASRTLRYCQSSMALAKGEEPQTSIKCKCGSLACVTLNIDKSFERWPFEYYDVRCSACGQQMELRCDGRALKDIQDEDEMIAEGMLGESEEFENAAEGLEFLVEEDDPLCALRNKFNQSTD
jgi:hypothetical protein